MSDDSPWCEACLSWHPVPRDRAHWLALQCFAPAPEEPLPDNTMGTFIHDAIIVTSSYIDSLRRAHEEARELGLTVTEIGEPAVNGYASFLITPDGSKEGHFHSNQAEAARRNWTLWAANATEEGLMLEWVHVRFGDEVPSAARVVDNCGYSPKGEGG